MAGTLLVQLPLNGTAAFEPTGNTPLAGGILAAACGLTSESVLGREEADVLGDRALADAIAARGPGTVGFTLYSWNVERSAHQASLLRKALPAARLIAGGPEVHPDNEWLVSSGAFDVLVSGEGEPSARILLGDTGIPRGTLVSTGLQDFPPGTYPDPWLSGVLAPGEDGSVMVETVRGCPSGCVYCSYRRRHPEPRIMPASEATGLARRLSALGGRELVFIDPTFNARPGFGELLAGLAGLGQKCFAELRGEGLDDSDADALHAAGFETVELGMQTSDRRVLEICGRPSDPTRVVAAASMLLAHGISPVMDIILGLPGDSRNGPVTAARMLADAGAGSRVQAFYLSALPGTGIRSFAAAFGVTFMDRPPYYVVETPWGGVGEMHSAREEISDILGYDADLEARPLLIEGWPGTETFDLDSGGCPRGDPPSYRHGSLRLSSRDLWRHRGRIETLVRRRMEADPFCVLDVVLEPRGPFPSDLPDWIRCLAPRNDYSSRMAARHGIEGNLRVSTLLRDPGAFDRAWLDGLTDECTVVADASAPGSLPAGLEGLGIGTRLRGGGWDLAELAASTDDPLSIFFESELLERLWCSIHLGSD